jgi:hypothetical protein
VAQLRVCGGSGFGDVVAQLVEDVVVHLLGMWWLRGCECGVSVVGDMMSQLLGMCWLSC